MTYENIQEWLIKQRPVRHGKILWLMIYEAVCKQIGASPKVFEAHPKPVRLCPACGSTFIEMNGVLMKHCGNCGQALKEEDK